tara:strand:- start:1257 stop:1967 length:711 start_codon:yes stop_codon:yes gene_type:complete
MAVGRPISLTPNIASKSVSATATAAQTSFTVTGGYRINELGVYRNGVRLVQGKDFTASDGSTVTLLSGATVGDLIEFVIFDSFNIADAIKTVGDQTLQGELTATSGFTIGITSAGTLINDDSGPTGITSMNFVGTGNTFSYNSTTKTVDISISGGSGGGGIGTAIKYSDETTDSPFSYIEPSAIVEENLDLNTTNAGVTSTYIVSVIPTVQVISGVAVTVGSGKTMVIDVLQLGGR